MALGMSTSPDPQLPYQYRLVRLDASADLRDEAARAARAGGEEGTLLWVESRRPGSAGGTANGGEGGLHAALILRPEQPRPQVLQLAYVALGSLGLAVAELWPAMATLRYRWPDGLLINGVDSGRVWLSYAPDDSRTLEWLVVGLSLDGSEAEDISVATALEHFCRHFLARINHWDAQGFDAVRAHFLERAEGRGEPIAVRSGDGLAAGRFIDLDARGNLLFEDGRLVRLDAVFPPRPLSVAGPESDDHTR